MEKIWSDLYEAAKKVLKPRRVSGGKWLSKDIGLRYTTTLHRYPENDKIIISR